MIEGPVGHTQDRDAYSEQDQLGDDRRLAQDDHGRDAQQAER